MNIQNIQEAYLGKINRQKMVDGLQIDAAGHCAHIGKISPGCYGCFAPIICYGVSLGKGVGLPNVCNKNCPHCFDERTVQQEFEVPSDWTIRSEVQDEIFNYFIQFNQLESAFSLYTFTGVVETLFYLPVIKQYMDYFRNEIEKNIVKIRGWAKLYTNGTLLTEKIAVELRNMGIDEIRINPSASGFSDQVYTNIKMAVEVLPVVTVEIPSWPPYRKKILEMLPIIDELGVSHLDICQVELGTPYCFNRVTESLPEAQVYQGHFMMLDDGGMVEEIFKAVIENDYAYSVLDCNAFVKQIYSNQRMKSFLAQHCGTSDFGTLCSTDVYGASR
jgi:pyruvate formate-lyase activating enzyme-like uncharacterized protein